MTRLFASVKRSIKDSLSKNSIRCISPLFIATTDVSGCIKKVIYLSDGTSFPFLISISAIKPTLSMDKEIGRTPLRLDALLLLELPLLLQFAKFVALVTALSMVRSKLPRIGLLWTPINSLCFHFPLLPSAPLDQLIHGSYSAPMSLVPQLLHPQDHLPNVALMLLLL